MPKTTEQPGAYSVRETQRLIGPQNITRAAIYDAVKAGTIPSLRIGTRVLIPRAWLLDKLNGGK
jgi:hypothetical protein